MSLNNNSSSNLSSAIPNIKETSLYCLISKGYLHFLPLKLGMNKLRIKERLMKCIDGDDENKETVVNSNKPSDSDSQPTTCSQTPNSPARSNNSNNTHVNHIHKGEYSKDLFSAVKDNDYYYSHFLTNKSVSSLNGSIYDTTKSSSAMIDINSDFSNQSEDTTTDGQHHDLSKLHGTTVPLSAEFSSTSGEDLTELLNNYSSHSIYLPNHYIEASASSNNPKLKEMLYEIFPHWELENEDIKIMQLTGGITNMLLSCSKYNKETKNNEKILVRSYGRGTSLIIDRDREFVSHLVLNSFNLAPPIHCRFGNGLVYGYLKGRSISPDEMALPYIYPFIAQRLGQWHNLIKAELIDESIHKFKMFNRKMNGEENDEDVEFIKDIWTLIKNWIKVVPEIDGLVKVCEDNKDIQEPHSGSAKADMRTILTTELNWVYNEISQKSPIVVSHCDLLSGNVIIPKDTTSLQNYDLSANPDKKLPNLESNQISFIDYEYMMPAPRGFDISNHFMEWQGFDCDKEKIPVPSIDNVVMKNWAKSYLHLNDEDRVINGNDDEEDEKLLKQLIDEIYLYYGLPGFYWGVWAGIQSNISLIDFDYSTYSGLRLSEYWDWKRKYLSTRK